MAITTYTLEDHLTSTKPSTDATWLRLDALVLRWLYGSMAMDLVDLVMPTLTAADAPVATANTVWLAVHGLFNNNKKTRKVYLAEEFCNVKQEDLSIGGYLNLQKAAADALAEVGAPVSDSDLITNIIKGLDEHFDSVTDIAPLPTLLPTFLNFRNMLLLQEMKVARRTANTSASAFVAKVPAPTTRKKLTRSAPNMATHSAYAVRCG
jgi:hypothetical protein